MPEELVKDAGQDTATQPPATSAAPKVDAQPSSTPPAAAPKGDGENWVPSYRLRETTDRYDKELKQVRDEFSAYREEQEARVRAAFGLGERPDPQAEKVREQFFQVFPQFKRLERLAGKLSTDEDVDKLVNAQEVYEKFQSQFYTNQGHAMFDNIDTLLAEAYGKEAPKLATQAAYSAFQTYLQIEPTAQSKFSRGDQSVVRDFWQAYTSGVLEPHRKHFSAQEAARRANAARIPRGGPGTDVIGAKREKKSYKDIDEATDAAFDMLKEQRP